MTLVEQIDQDMIQAMKNQEKGRLMVIRMVKAALKQEMIDHKKELTDEVVIDVVNKQIKMRQDSITEFSKAGRSDLVEANEQEIAVLKKYLPEQLSDEEVNLLLDQVFDTVRPTSEKDMGLIMREITPKVKGRYDMRLLSDKVKSKLNER